MEPQPRRAALGGVYTHTPPRRTTPDGETTSPRGGGRTSEEKEKGMTQGVLSFHGALLSMIEPFFFTFRPSSFVSRVSVSVSVSESVSESVSDVM